MRSMVEGDSHKLRQLGIRRTRLNQQRSMSFPLHRPLTRSVPLPRWGRI
jgi:hypothetical protein